MTTRMVIAVSVDGCRSIDVLPRLMAAGQLPAFSRLATEGASTMAARSVSKTVTLPNHSSMMTARPVVGASGHGTLTNRDPTSTMHQLAGETVFSIFDTVWRQYRVPTLSYVGKDKFRHFEDSYSPDSPTEVSRGHDPLETVIDQTIKWGRSGSPIPLVQKFVDRIESSLAGQPIRFSFLHFAGPDVVGHNTSPGGWESKEYERSLEAVDEDLGVLLGKIDEWESKYSVEVYLILTSDHGGGCSVRQLENGSCELKTGHNIATAPVNFTIPFFVWNRTRRPLSSDLYDAAAIGRQRVAESVTESLRHRYQAAVYLPPPSDNPSDEIWPDVRRSPIRNAMLGNLAIWLLGIEPIPGSSYGVLRDGRTFHPLLPVYDHLI